MSDKSNLNNDETSSTLADIKLAAESKYAAVKDKAIHLAQDASEKASELKEYLIEKSQDIKSQAIKAEESASTYIKDNPWKSVGIGVVVGAILTKLCFGRNKK